jgi:hypothetical protein
MSLGTRLIGLEEGVLSRRVSLIVAGTVLLVLLSGVVLAFLAVALHASLILRFSPVEAALLVAAAAFLLLLFIAVLTVAAIRRTRRNISLAVRSSTLAAVAPPALSLAFRHVGLGTLAAVAFGAFMMARRR